MRYSLAIIIGVLAVSNLIFFQNCSPIGETTRQGDSAAVLPVTRESLAALNFPQELSNPSSVIFARAFPNLTFNAPIMITSARDASNRMFVVERAGVIRVFPNSSAVTLAPVFLNISARVSTEGEQGLLGLAFPPDFKNSGYFFVHYSANAGARRSVFSRFRVSAANPNVADPLSETLVLEVAQPAGLSNHKGGSINFGPDGFLYMALGDGGGGGDPFANGPNLRQLLGKVLRINVSTLPYTIPADNPFGQNRCATAVGTVNCGEIWAYGVRNPFRWSFDRVTGELWMADVGQDAWEEIDIIKRGGNYGWNAWEGNHLYNNTVNPPAQTPPIHEYNHTVGQSITGGYVYRGNLFPALKGGYFYSDFNSGAAFALIYNGTQVVSNTSLGNVPFVASFGEDEQGELYAVNLVAGTVLTLSPNPNQSAPTLPGLLSQTGLFTNLATLSPAQGMMEYEVNSPLWSDNAIKRRWMGIPTNQRIQFSVNGPWGLPAQSVLVKHFELTLANGQTRRLETRVLILMKQGWTGFTYRWNAQQTDATLTLNQATENFQVINSQNQTVTQTWTYPGTSACMRCHTQVSGFVLGLSTAQSNRKNQLQKWNQLGLFQNDIGPANAFSALAALDDNSRTITDRARSYLHSNCANCHQPNGPTAVDMDLRFGAANMNVLNVPPTTGDLGLVNPARVRSGSRTSSVIYERLQRLDGSRMPPLGSAVIDVNGLSVIGQWIDGI